MNDSFEPMRRVLVVGLLVACGEHPSLRVEVTHHDDARPVVTRTTITVYESDIVSCEKVEFGDLSEAELTAIEVDQIAVGPGEPADELTMSREGTKVIVARGFDESGVLIAADCAEKGTVGEGDVLQIGPTNLAASVSVNGIGLDDADPFGIFVTVTDPFVRSLDSRVVSWRVHGSDGAQPIDETDLLPPVDSAWVPAGPPCTNASGVARVHPVPPSTIGGFATAVRTSWSTEPPRVFTTFTPINGSGALAMDPVQDGLNTSSRRCASRISGTVHRLVCLEDRGVPTAVDYPVIVVNGGATIVRAGAAEQTFGALPVGERPLHLFSVSRAASTRDVYALTNKGRIVGVFGPSLGADPAIKLAAAEDPGDLTDVTVLPACGTEGPAVLARFELGTGEKLLTLPISETGLLGAGKTFENYLSPSVSAVENLSINATGCLAELQEGGDTIVHQVGVVDVTGRVSGPRNTTTAYFTCASGTCQLPFAVARAGVGFLPADELHPERMVGATFDASGTILSVTVLQPDKARIPRPVELERITAASFPQRVVTGQFDADGLPDLFWDIANPNIATTNFQISYAHPVLGERLSALSGTQQDAFVVDTFVADVTGDGADDLVISSQDKVLNPTKHGVLVIPGQVPIANIPIQRDESCNAP